MVGHDDGRDGRWHGLGHSRPIRTRDRRYDRRFAGEPDPCFSLLPRKLILASGPRCGLGNDRDGYWRIDDLRANRGINAR